MIVGEEEDLARRKRRWCLRILLGIDRLIQGGRGCRGRSLVGMHVCMMDVSSHVNSGLKIGSFPVLYIISF